MQMRAGSALSATVAAAVVILGLPGCGGHELGSASDAKAFIRDIGEGKGAGGWKLTGDAAREARQAFADKELLKAVADEVKEVGCAAAEVAEKARGELGRTRAGDEALARLKAQQNGATGAQADNAVNDIEHDLDQFEVANVISGACSLSEM